MVCFFVHAAEFNWFFMNFIDAYFLADSKIKKNYHILN